MRIIWKTRPDSWTITIEQNVQLQVFKLDQNDRPAATSDLHIFSLTQFTQTFFNVSLQNLYHISISQISQMGSKLGRKLDRK